MSQANVCTSAAIKVTHAVRFANSQQGNLASGAEIFQDNTTHLTFAGSQQSNAATSGVISQTFGVRGADSISRQQASQAAIKTWQQYPLVVDVRTGVLYGPTGEEFVGELEAVEAGGFRIDINSGKLVKILDSKLVMTL